MVAVAGQPALPWQRAGPMPPPRAGAPLAHSRSPAMRHGVYGRLPVRGLSQDKISSRIFLYASGLLRVLRPQQPVTAAKVLQLLVPSRLVARAPARVALAAAQDHAARRIPSIGRLARSLSLTYWQGGRLPFSVIDHRRIGAGTTGSRKAGRRRGTCCRSGRHHVGRDGSAAVRSQRA
jgi:hypothetical protein